MDVSAGVIFFVAGVIYLAAAVLSESSTVAKRFCNLLVPWSSRPELWALVIGLFCVAGAVSILVVLLIS